MPLKTCPNLRTTSEKPRQIRRTAQRIGSKAERNAQRVAPETILDVCRATSADLRKAIRNYTNPIPIDRTDYIIYTVSIYIQSK